MKFHFFLYLFFWTLLIPKIFAQEDSTRSFFTDNLSVSGQFGAGFLMAHRGSLESLVNSYTSSFFFDIGKTTFGKKAWEQLYNYPTLGIGYYHGSLGNKDIFGHSDGIYGFIESPYFQEKTISFTYKFGFGLAYLNKKYDLNDNIYNVAIGSHVNYLINFSFDLRLKLLQDKLFLKTGLGFKHMSNGKTQTPNLGLNIFDWHITAGYYIGNRKSKIKKHIHQRKKHTFIAVIAGGLKEFTVPDLGKYFAGNTTLEYEYSIRNKISGGVGADVFYDGVVDKELSLLDDSESRTHAVRFGLHATYVIYYHKIGFIVQFGSYLAPYYRDDGYIYHRVGFRTKITKHLLANITMKTHWGKADIVEFGLAYFLSK